MSPCRNLSGLLALSLAFAAPAAHAEDTVSDKLTQAFDALRKEVELSRATQDTSINLLSKQMTEVLSKVGAIEQRLEALEKNTQRVSPFPADVTEAVKVPDMRLLQDLEALRRELELARSAQEALNRQLSDGVTDLRSRTAALEARVDALERSSRRISPFPVQTAVQTGTIRLENRLGVGAMISVNGVSYRLPPFQAQDLPGQPAGTFTYEVLVDGFGQLTPRVARTLQPNQVFTIYTY